MIQSKTYSRKTKEIMPVLAICYDFDKTLSIDDMQAQGYIQSVGFSVENFWKEANLFAEENDMDYILASMFKMQEKAKGKFDFTREKLEEYGSKITLFPGVADWFQRIKAYGLEQGIIVEHYIISCGIKEMIEGTSIAKEGSFEKIYASSYYYDTDGTALWPAQAINYTTKTQFLTRIQKGVLAVNDFGVNDSFQEETIRVPYRNMVYIGDSDTDIPCMQLVNQNGGYAIGVYDPNSEDKEKVFRMIQENRIKYFTPADYTENGSLDILIKNIIEQTAKRQILEDRAEACKLAASKSDK